MSVIRYRYRFPTQVVESPFLDMFKIQLDVVLSNLLY